MMDFPVAQNVTTLRSQSKIHFADFVKDSITEMKKNIISIL